MWHLPMNGNHIIQYITGDGFRTKLPLLLRNNTHLLVTTRSVINSELKNTTARCVTVHGLAKLLDGRKLKEQCIVLDIRIPRTGTRALEILQRACKDKHLIILHPPLLDVKSVNNLMTLLALTKYKKLKVRDWSLFLFNKVTY